LKILIITHSLSAGGTERVVSNMANTWAAAAREVSVVTIASRVHDYYHLDPSVQRIALDLEQISDNPLTALGNNLRRIIALRRAVRLARPDVIVAMMATSICLARLATLGLKITVIGSERIHPPTLPLGAAWERLRRWLYPGLSAIVAQTERSAAWLRNECGAANVVVIANSITLPLPIGKTGSLPPQQVMGEQQSILAVGRLETQKGFDLLIEAFAILRVTQPRWHLIILGEGSARGALQQRLDALGLHTRVHLPGNVGNPADWYEAADIFVMSSRFEGFPNALIEAMAYGLPVVSFDCETGPAEVIEDGSDGLLVRAGDTQALADALTTLMSDETLRHRLATQARKSSQRYSAPRITAQWDALIDKLLNER